jgi:hypothetical protein
MTKINPEFFNSDLRNFRETELDTLAEYTQQFKKAASESPEMAMYNWPRYVRTQEITRFITFYEIYKHIQEIHGSIFQVGVLEGNTLFTYAHLIENFEHRNYTRKIYAFDTYGENDYAEVSEQDGEYLNRNVKTVPRVSSFDALKESGDLHNKSRAFNQFKQIEWIQGNAAETVKSVLENDRGLVVSLLNLQISLYAVEKEVLKLAWPRIPKGGVIHFASLGYEGSPSVGQMLDEAVGISNVNIKRFSFATKPSFIIKE